MFFLCRHCDRGDRYCSGTCAERARRTSLREAGRRYQHSRRGRFRHAARQARYRAHRTANVLVDFGSSGVGGVPLPSHPNYGLFQFKAGLGCRLVGCLPYQDLVFRRLAYQTFRRVETSLLPRVHRLLARAPALVGVMKRAV
ncbi:MAG: hypothetical protein AUH29_16285 [Candidatus Rokubacteria bacterium 13_1_40CM_69_27]|nr:MAG: hypothetical protein AUH29_16285 [Candidatus Rokubacteria bacterium 13_1_40CM_69_27]